MKRNSSLHVLLLAAWGTYMTAYLCRVNLSTVLDKLSAGLGVSVEYLGLGQLAVFL